MSKRINPGAAWVEYVEVPRDGEGVDGSDVELPVADVLANTKYLMQRYNELVDRFEVLEKARGGFTLSTRVQIDAEPLRDYSSEVYIGKTDGFADAVTLSLQGLPAGVTVSWSDDPATASNGTITTTAATVSMTISVGDGVTPGPYDITVAGVAGTRSAMTKLRLNVAAATLPGTFFAGITTSSLNKNPDILSVYTQVTRAGGFNDPITFSIPSLPAGVVAAWSVNPPTATGAAAFSEGPFLALNYTNAAPGTYDIQIRATSGSTVRTFSQQLIVDAPAPSPQQDFTLEVQYEPGDPLITTRGTLIVNRAGGYSGPVTLVGGSVNLYDNMITLGVTINGSTVSAISGNTAELRTIRKFGGSNITVNQGDGVANLPAGHPKLREVICTASATIGGVQVTRSFVVKVRVG